MAGRLVSKWFLFCSCLVFSRSFVHDCKTAKCFPNQGGPKFGQIRAKSKAALKFDISRLCPQTFNYRQQKATYNGKTRRAQPNGIIMALKHVEIGHMLLICKISRP